MLNTLFLQKCSIRLKKSTNALAQTAVTDVSLAVQENVKTDLAVAKVKSELTESQKFFEDFAQVIVEIFYCHEPY